MCATTAGSISSLLCVARSFRMSFFSTQSDTLLMKSNLNIYHQKLNRTQVWYGIKARKRKADGSVSSRLAEVHRQW